MNKSNIIKTIIFTIVVMQSLFFIPENTLKNYNIIGYSIVLGLYIMMATINLSKERTLIQLIIDNSIYFSVLIPLALLLYINVKYKDIIENDASNVSNYTTLKVISTILLMFQTYTLSNYIMYSKSTNTLLGILLLTILNSGVSGLLWTQVEFFVTDGFQS